MSVLGNRYEEFGKSIMMKYSGLDQAYDPLTFLFPKLAEADQDAATQAPQFTNIYQLYYLKEENHLFAKNISFLTNLLEKRIQGGNTTENIILNAQKRVEVLLREQLPQTERTTINEIITKVSRLFFAERENKLREKSIVTILKEHGITKQLDYFSHELTQIVQAVTYQNDRLIINQQTSLLRDANHLHGQGLTQISKIEAKHKRRSMADPIQSPLLSRIWRSDSMDSLPKRFEQIEAAVEQTALTTVPTMHLNDTDNSFSQNETRQSVEFYPSDKYISLYQRILAQNNITLPNDRTEKKDRSNKLENSDSLFTDDILEEGGFTYIKQEYKQENLNNEINKYSNLLNPVFIQNSIRNQNFSNPQNEILPITDGRQQETANPWISRYYSENFAMQNGAHASMDYFYRYHNSQFLKQTDSVGEIHHSNHYESFPQVTALSQSVRNDHQINQIFPGSSLIHQNVQSRQDIMQNFYYETADQDVIQSKAQKPSWHSNNPISIVPGTGFRNILNISQISNFSSQQLKSSKRDGERADLGYSLERSDFTHRNRENDEQQNGHSSYTNNRLQKINQIDSNTKIPKIKSIAGRENIPGESIAKMIFAAGKEGLRKMNPVVNAANVPKINAAAYQESIQRINPKAGRESLLRMNPETGKESLSRMNPGSVGESLLRTNLEAGRESLLRINPEAGRESLLRTNPEAGKESLPRMDPRAGRESPLRINPRAGRESPLRINPEAGRESLLRTNPEAGKESLPRMNPRADRESLLRINPIASRESIQKINAVHKRENIPKTQLINKEEHIPKTSPVYGGESAPKTDHIYEGESVNRTEPIYGRQSIPRISPIYGGDGTPKISPIYGGESAQRIQKRQPMHMGEVQKDRSLVDRSIKMNERKPWSHGAEIQKRKPVSDGAYVQKINYDKTKQNNLSEASGDQSNLNMEASHAQMGSLPNQIFMQNIHKGLVNINSYTSQNSNQLLNFSRERSGEDSNISEAARLENRTTEYDSIGLFYRQEKAQQQEESKDQQTYKEIQRELQFIKETRTAVEKMNESYLGWTKKQEQQNEMLVDLNSNRGRRMVQQEVERSLGKRMNESVNYIYGKVYRKLEERIRIEKNRRGMI